MTLRQHRSPSWILLAAALAGPASAAPLQLTSGPFNSLGPSLSADGSRLAFYSATNPTGGNGDHSFEVFIYERGSGQMRQISHEPGGPLAGGNQTPSLSGDGSRLTFQHFSISGNTAFFQTQAYDLGTQALTSLTPLGGFETAAISRDSRTIAVATSNLGLRLYDTAAQSFSSVLMASPAHFTMSGDARFIAYETYSQSVRLHDVLTGTTTVISPTGSGFNQRPSLSADGRSLVFTATGDPLGQNADHSSELFRYDILTQTLVQVTHTSGHDAIEARASGDGSRIVFSSSADFTGSNVDGNYEVFVYDLLADSFLQLTDTLGSFSGSATLSEDGLAVAYMSTATANGSQQVFLDTLAPQDGERLPEPASLALALTALGLIPALRRRQVG